LLKRKSSFFKARPAFDFVIAAILNAKKFTFRVRMTQENAWYKLKYLRSPLPCIKPMLLCHAVFLSSPKEAIPNNLDIRSCFDVGHLVLIPMNPCSPASPERFVFPKSKIKVRTWFCSCSKCYSIRIMRR